MPEFIWNEQHSPPLGVSDVARMLPATRRTLDRRVAEALGRSVLDEIKEYRFARAQRLLIETNIPVKSSVYLAGFPSRERMRLMFLEGEGIPPSVARRVASQVIAAHEAGADQILVTCSSSGTAVERAAGLIETPVLRVDQPLADGAWRLGSSTEIPILSSPRLAIAFLAEHQ